MAERPSEGGGNWNRAGRRSGGCRPMPLTGPAPDDGPVQSIQCFEGRHGDCFGTCVPFMPSRCECPCHKTDANNVRMDLGITDPFPPELGSARTDQ